MKVVLAAMDEPGEVVLVWETAKIAMEPDSHEVILRDSELFRSLLTEYLDADTDEEGVFVINTEWVVESPETAAKNEIIPGEIETMETELSHSEEDSHKKCDQGRDSHDASIASLDSDVETQDEGSVDQQDSATVQTRSECDRCAASEEELTSASKLVGDHGDSRMVRIEYYNATPNLREATFFVFTRSRNVNDCLTFIMRYPTKSLESCCSVIETLEITQNTGVDWVDCDIEYENVEFKATCRRGIPMVHCRDRLDFDTRLIRTFDAYKSTNCMWSIEFSDSGMLAWAETHKCKIYAAGEFVGDFVAEWVASIRTNDSPYCGTTFRVRDVMIDKTITVQDNSDGSQQLTLSELEEEGVDITVLGMNSSKWGREIYLEPGIGYTLPLPGTGEWASAEDERGEPF